MAKNITGYSIGFFIIFYLFVISIQYFIELTMNSNSNHS